MKAKGMYFPNSAQNLIFIILQMQLHKNKVSFKAGLECMHAPITRLKQNTWEKQSKRKALKQMGKVSNGFLIE